MPQSEHWGNAAEIKATSEEPAIDFLILTYEGSGHVGVVTSFTSKSVTFEESNYYKGKRSTRTLLLDSKLIRGYAQVLFQVPVQVLPLSELVDFL